MEPDDNVLDKVLASLWYLRGMVLKARGVYHEWVLFFMNFRRHKLITVKQINRDSLCMLLVPQDVLEVGKT